MHNSHIIILFIVTMIYGCGTNDEVMMRLNAEIPGTDHKVHLVKMGGDATVGYSLHISIIPKSLNDYDGKGNVVICDNADEVTFTVRNNEVIIYGNSSVRFFKKESLINGIKISYELK